jgi:8-oxo-dGTP pyrophosphatase MutT (NUDIX family)
MLDLVLIKKTLASPLTPEVLNNNTGKLSAVLIIIYGKIPTIIMTERPKTMNHHAGEISFPGGTWNVKDHDLLSTAIRETKEELGIEIERESIIGQLKTVTTLNSGFKITPFITIMDATPEIHPNSEIASVLKIPLIPLLNTMQDDTDPNHKSIQEMFVFTFNNHIIWGASARMLRQIHTKLIS